MTGAERKTRLSVMENSEICGGAGGSQALKETSYLVTALQISTNIKAVGVKRKNKYPGGVNNGRTLRKKLFSLPSKNNVEGSKCVS